MAVYLACLIFIGAVGYNLNFGKTGKRINEFFVEKTILGLIKDNPNDPELPAMLGDLYYSINNYEKAKNAYEQSLAVYSGNPRVLNNLAWLYATCEDKKIKNADMAVMLAEAAAKKEENEHTCNSFYNNELSAIKVWWRRRESNPRPEAFPHKHLRV